MADQSLDTAFAKWVMFTPFAPLVAMTMIGMRVVFVAHDELKRYARSPLK